MRKRNYDSLHSSQIAVSDKLYTSERKNKQTNNVIICYTNQRVTFSFERVRFWICRRVIGWRCM